MAALGLVAAGWLYGMVGWLVLVVMDDLSPTLRRLLRDDRAAVASVPLLLGLLAWPALVVMWPPAQLWREWRQRRARGL